MKNSRFANLSITDKLQHLQLISVGFALAFTLMVSSGADFWERRQQILADADAVGKILGFNVAATLLFNDNRSANDILKALYNKPNIIAAQVYTLKGAPFAEYQAKNHADIFPGSLNTNQPLQQPENSGLVLIHKLILPIKQNDETVGYLYLIVDLKSMWTGLVENILQVSLVSFLAFALTVFYGRRFALLISKPIIHLSLVAQQVTREKNYTLRAQGDSRDEIGQLVKNFNRMIGRIQQRDVELQQQRQNLKAQVETRTADLLKAVTEAQAASVAKSQFLATMSHEIRTPMNGVLGMIDLLLNTGLDETQKNYAETVYNSANSLLGLLNEILDYSKIEAGKLQLEQIDFSLSDMLSQLQQLFIGSAQSKNIDLRCHISEALADNFCGDDYRIRQILINLLSNAIKFTDNGSVALSVSQINVDQEAINGAIWLNFQIRDTGIGMSPEALEKIFTTFSQADSSTTRKYGGTGLGLAICKELTALMGGKIEVKSVVGVYTEFSVQLPIKLAEQPLNNPMLSSTTPAILPQVIVNQQAYEVIRSQLQGTRILLAEDNPVNQKIAEAMVHFLCCELIIANDGKEALALYERGGIDMILMDCMMPEMDGYTATKTIRALEKTARRAAIPILALTANAMEGDREKCLAAGMSDYLAKPILLDDLCKKLLSMRQQISTPMPTDFTDKQQPANLTEVIASHELLFFDPQPLATLTTIGGPALVGNLIDLFKSSSAQHLVNLQKASEDRDLIAARHAAHALKSAAAHIGGIRLAEIARQIEFSATDGTLVWYQLKIAAFHDERQLLLELISRHLGQNLGQTTN